MFFRLLSEILKQPSYWVDEVHTYSISDLVSVSFCQYILTIHTQFTQIISVQIFLIILIQKFQQVNFTIGIKHGFSCINIRQVPWEVLKTEAEGRGFQHLPRDLANVNALKNHVRSLLLHKNWKHLLHFALCLALFCFAFSPMSRECNFHWLYSF